MSFASPKLPTGEIATTYADYLETKYWSMLKDLYLNLFVTDGIFCDCCTVHSSQYIELHHMSYENLGNMEEEVFDIIKVCRDCHGMIHEKELENLDPFQALRESRKIRFEMRRKDLDSFFDCIHFPLRRVPMALEGSDRKSKLTKQIDEYLKQGLLSEAFVKTQRM